MKKYVTIAILFLISRNILAQEFSKNLTAARSAYGSGNLEDARFNLQNALHDVDMTIGKEILKVLPATLDGASPNVKEDNITGMSSGFAGLYVHRVYGTPEKSSLEIISDSPMLGAVNTFLALPAIMTNRDPSQKVVKIHGYKSLLKTERDGDNTITSYETLIPFGNSLLTFRYKGNPGEAKILALAETLPVEQIMKLAQ